MWCFYVTSTMTPSGFIEKIIASSHEKLCKFTPAPHTFWRLMHTAFYRINIFSIFASFDTTMSYKVRAGPKHFIR